jgi:hypothetical protein
MGAARWWEPVLAVALTLIAIAVLVVFSGRVYAGAILHTGPTLKVSDAWRRTTTPRATASATATSRTHDRLTGAVVGGSAVGLGLSVGLLTRDLAIGIAVGTAFYAAATRLAKALAGRSDRHHYGHH